METWDLMQLVYLSWDRLSGSRWKLWLTVISWANLRLERSLADSMTSSSVKVLGGLAVGTNWTKFVNKQISVLDCWSCMLAVAVIPGMWLKIKHSAEIKLTSMTFLREENKHGHKNEKEKKEKKFRWSGGFWDHWTRKRGEGANSQEGVQCLLEQSLVKLSREQSKSLVEVILSQRSDDDSTSLPWSSPLDVEVGRSSFRGILGYSCTWEVGNNP